MVKTWLNLAWCRWAEGHTQDHGQDPDSRLLGPHGVDSARAPSQDPLFRDVFMLTDYLLYAKPLPGSREENSLLSG